MQEVIELFNRIRQNRQEIVKGSIDKLSNEFDDYLRTVMESLSKQLGRDLSKT